MEFVDLITNTGFDPINRNILDSLNYEELKQFCQTSKEIEDYIKENSLKWKLLEKLDERKCVIKHRGESMPSDICEEVLWGDLEVDQPDEYFWATTDETPIIKLFGRETFEYFEKEGNTAQLTLFLDFIKAYLDNQRTHHWTSPLQFAVQKNRIDFVNLMIAAPLPLEDLDLNGHIGGIWLMPMAVRNDDIEMVKLLLKFSEEKDVNLDVSSYNLETGVSENILGLATRLGHFKIAQLIQDVFEGKIDKKDLQPVIRKFE